MTAPRKLLWPVSRAAGFHTFLYGWRIYGIQREALVRDGGGGRVWEVVVWDRTMKSWVASHPEAPDGFFPTLREAKNALEDVILERIGWAIKSAQTYVTGDSE